jgi:hypothetical protein
VLIYRGNRASVPDAFDDPITRKSIEEHRGRPSPVRYL